MCMTLVMFTMMPRSVKAENLRQNKIQDQQKASCIPVDLIFLVDQSYDMADFDPKNMREQSIKWIINYLGYDRLFECPDIVNRVGFIGIGELENQVDLTPIRPDPTDPKFSVSWEKTLDELMNEMAINQPSDRTFDSLKSALEKGIQTLNDAPNIGTEQRGKAIVLIMAGDGDPCTPSTCTHYQVRGEQTELMDVLDGENGLDASSSFSVITYGDGSYNKYRTRAGDKNFAEFWKDIVEKHNGRYEYLRKGSVSTAKFIMDLLLELSPHPDVQYVCGLADVDPMLDKVGINVISETPLNNLNFRMSQSLSNILGMSAVKDLGNLVHPASQSNPENVVYFLYEQPTAGSWEFELNCNNNKALAYMQSDRAQHLIIIEPQDTLPQFKKGNSLFDPENPYYFKFSVGSSPEKPLEDSPGYQADVAGSVSGGGDEPLPLTFDYKDGIFTSKEALPTDHANQYSVHVELKVPHVNGKTGDFLISYDGEYTVAARTPFKLELLSPSADSRVPIHGNPFDHWMMVRPFKVVVRLQPADIGEDGVDLKQAILGNRESAIKIVLLSPDQEVEEAWLTPSPTDPLQYIGQLGEKIYRPGKYSMSIEFVGEYDKSKFLLIDSDNSRIEFRRQDSVFEYPQFYQTLGALLLTIFFCLVIYYIIIKTNQTAGYLLFIPPGEGMLPFHVLDLSEKKRRYVRYRDNELKDQNFLLSNLTSVSAYTPLFSSSRQMIEIDGDHAFEVYKNSDEDILLKKPTNAGYRIRYSPKNPAQKSNEAEQ